ncbi:MAG: hypothetical protein ACP6KW_02080 [Candidatus Thorarchaeota archaeon]
MQTFYNYISFVIILQALFIQSVWLYIGRQARDRYLGDIMHFRSPSSRLSRYYGWRVQSFGNALLEGVGLQVVLIASIVGVSISLSDYQTLLNQAIVVLFVAILTFMSSVQLAWRVRAINTTEENITTSLKISEDKIGVARRMVEDLYQQGEMGDGQMWFALFRIAQRPDPIGWAVRDVLMEKGKDEERRMLREFTRLQAGKTTSDDGPGIES